jgi:hypothetical protein
MTCRRCTVCEGMAHHWVEHCDAAVPPTYTHHCKHCETVGMMCDDCDTEGCDACDQEGVIPVGIHDCEAEC